MNGHDPLDREARKQLLLARIAVSRNELRRDIAQIHRASHPTHLLRALVGDSVGGTLRRAFMGGRAGGTDVADWIGIALAWLRRYRVAMSLVGGVLPLVRGRRRWRRLVKLAGLGAVAWTGWRALRARGDSASS